MSHGRIITTLNQQPAFDDIYQAAKADEFDNAKLLLKNIDIDRKKDGITPAQKLASEGQHGAVFKLLRKGAHIKYVMQGYLDAGFLATENNARRWIAGLFCLGEKDIYERMVSEAKRCHLTFDFAAILKWKKISDREIRQDTHLSRTVHFQDNKNNTLAIVVNRSWSHQIECGFTYTSDHITGLMKSLLDRLPGPSTDYSNRSSVGIPPGTDLTSIKEGIDLIDTQHSLSGILDEVYTLLGLPLSQIDVNESTQLYRTLAEKEEKIAELIEDNTTQKEVLRLTRKAYIEALKLVDAELDSMLELHKEQTQASIGMRP